MLRGEGMNYEGEIYTTREPVPRLCWESCRAQTELSRAMYVHEVDDEISHIGGSGSN